MKKDRPVPAEVQAAFAVFWAAYPRPLENPRKPALRVFADLVASGADPEALARAAGAYQAFVRANAIAPKFIPHARTWLSQGRHEDYLTADAPASAHCADNGAGPSPEHPLAALFDSVGPDRRASYFAPLVISRDGDAVMVVALTKFALDRVRRDWGRDIEAVLGPVSWAVRRAPNA